MKFFYIVSALLLLFFINNSFVYSNSINCSLVKCALPKCPPHQAPIKMPGGGCCNYKCSPKGCEAVMCTADIKYCGPTEKPEGCCPCTIPN